MVPFFDIGSETLLLHSALEGWATSLSLNPVSWVLLLVCREPSQSPLSALVRYLIRLHCMLINNPSTGHVSLDETNGQNGCLAFNQSSQHDPPSNWRSGGFLHKGCQEYSKRCFLAFSFPSLAQVCAILCMATSLLLCSAAERVSIGLCPSVLLVQKNGKLRRWQWSSGHTRVKVNSWPPAHISKEILFLLKYGSTQNSFYSCSLTTTFDPYLI